MLNEGKIGFFDSGYGGLTVLKEVEALLPQYNYLYLGDNKRAPYGEKSQDEVYKYTWEGIQYLMKEGCELIILACNTASAKALRKIQQNNLLSFPEKRVLGVIRPSAEVVGTYSKTGQIVVLGTPGTVASRTYIDEFSDFSPHTIVHQYACPKWVPLIESGEYDSNEGISLIHEDLERIIKEFPMADIALLGCTHYPIIQNLIQDYFSDEIQVISQGEIVAKSLRDYLERHYWLEQKLIKEGKRNYLTTGDEIFFQQQGQKILGKEISVKHVEIS